MTGPTREASRTLATVSRILRPSSTVTVEPAFCDEAIDGPYFMVGQIYFESAEDLEAAMKVPTAAEAWADLPNFTNLQPVMQVSRILD
jgi:uncharacterized protein (TIGR02118 family)